MALSFGDSLKDIPSKGNTVVSWAQKLRDIFSKVSEVVQKAGTVIGNAIKTIVSVIGLIVATPIYLLYEGFQKLLTMDWSIFMNAFTNAKELLIEFINYIGELPIVDSIIEGIKTAFMTLAGVMVYFGTKVKEAFDRLDKYVFNAK